MNTPSSNHQQLSKDFSLLDISKTAKKYLSLMLVHWPISLLLVALFAAAGALCSYLMHPTYKASISFMIDDTEKGGGMLSGYMSLASQFGMGGGGAGALKNGALSDENAGELMKSRSATERALMYPVAGRHGQELLANFFVDAMKLRSKWNKNPKLINFTFKNKPAGTDRLQDSLIQSLHVKISKMLRQDKPLKQANILLLEVNTPNDSLSKYLAENLLRSLSESYTERKTAKSRMALQMVQDRADSVKNVLEGIEYRLAKNKDLTKKMVFATAFVSTGRLQRDETILNVMYAEVIKNLEIAKVSLTNQTPLIQVVDTPLFPIPKKKLISMPLGIALGSMLGFFAALAYAIYQQKRKITLSL